MLPAPLDDMELKKDVLRKAMYDEAVAWHPHMRAPRCFANMEFSCVDKIGTPKKSSGRYTATKSVLLTLYGV